MKTTLLVVFSILCLYDFSSFAQTRLYVVSEKKELRDATAILYRLPDSTSTTKAFTGDLVFEVAHHTAYHLTVTAVGMQQIDKKFFITNKPFTITLQWKARVNNLENVTVVSRKPVITQEEDKTIVDAEALASSSTNAYEVLEKTPGIIVDQDGNAYLNSATPATIYINGREVKLGAADLASLLKSLPANSITKIEILRNPSAKYDAASSGGIVNIVLKKGIKIGVNGSVNAGYFQGVYHTSTAGFNINKGDRKLNSYLSYQFTERDNFEELASKRFITTGNSVLSQKSFTTYPGINNYLSLGTSLYLTKRLTVAYDGRLSLNNNKSHAINNNDIHDQSSQTLLAQTQSLIDNRNATTYIGNELSAEYKIDSLGSEWDVEVEYNHFRSDNDQGYTNNFFLPANPALFGDGNTINNKNIVTAKTDLVWKLRSKYTVEGGAKINYSNSQNSARYFYETGSSGRKVDSFQTNKFRYREQISSVYLQASKTLFGFTLKPGIRLETTDINGRQLFPKDTTLSIKRTDLFPYVYLRHNLFKLMGFMLTANAVYRRSISRPFYEALNPYPKYIDQFLYEVGNPRLVPQFTTNYEFNVMADNIPVFSVGINDIKNIFTNVTYQDDVTKIAYRTYDNLGSNRETYLRFLGGVPPGGKYFFYAGGQYNHSHYQGLYQSQPLEYKRGSWTFFMYQNFRPVPTFNITLNGFMRLRGLQNFYELKSFGALNLTLNKAILKKKANIILSVNDILETNKVDFTISQSGINAFGSRVNDTRRIGLTLRYNFGIKPKEEKNQGFEQPEETKGN